MATNDELPPLIKKLLYAQDHELLDDPFGCSITRIIDAGVEVDQFIIESLDRRIQGHQIAQAFAGPFRIPRLHEGELALGRDLRDKWVRIPLQYTNAHSLTVGSSGSGKTMRALWMAMQIAPRVCCWLMDLRKAEFARLKQYLARLGVELLVVSGRDLKLNPLQVPPGVPPIEWASRAADMLIHVLQLPERASKLVHVSLLQLYREHGILDGGRNYPTLFDLRAAAAVADAPPQSKQALIDSLDPVLLSLGPQVLAYRVGWSSNELAQRRIVFELGGLAETDKNLILNTLILSELTSRVARGISNPDIDLWICVDEAARLVAPSNHASNIADLIGLVRGAGIGLDLSLQTSDISPAVLSNSACRFIGRCNSATDLDVIAGSMGLTIDQRRWIAVHLKPGMFVGQVGDAWRHPFVFSSPLLRLSSTANSPVAPDGRAASLFLPEA